MPRVFKAGSYWVYFWSDESRPLEPVHVHIAEGAPKPGAPKASTFAAADFAVTDAAGNALPSAKYAVELVEEGERRILRLAFTKPGLTVIVK